MKSDRNIARPTVSERRVTQAIGRSKATKFAAVEGLVLSQKSSRQLAKLKSGGLKGDALRSAIRKSFKKK